MHRPLLITCALFPFACRAPAPVERLESALHAPPAGQLTRLTPEDPSRRVPSFETGQVRPLSLSPDGSVLWAVNTPAQTVEAFQVGAAGLVHLQTITVGVEPCAVAARNGSEAWVVNHLSDSVSVVRLGQGVIRTIHVGDEPRDIVFAGPGRSRAFVSAAHRGQNAPVGPQLTTPGIGRADIYAFDANAVESDPTMSMAPLSITQVFTNSPRALAVSPDGRYVYAAGFLSGNQTAAINPGALNLLGPGQAPPFANVDGVPAPLSGTVVKWSPAAGHWLDDAGRVLDQFINFFLPDKDVFVIDAAARPPAQVSGAAGTFAHVGTVLFNMAVNPASGRVYVSNLESRNLTRFEGHGPYDGRQGVQGHLAESRITVIDPASGAVTPRHLNKHIDYSQCCAPIPNDENARSLAFPTGMAVSSDGATLYVAALGSSALGVYGTAELENDQFVPSTANQIALSGGGPTGLVLDEAHGRLYTLTRFDDAIKIVDTTTRSEVGAVPLYNPEPAFVVAGRHFLYDAHLSSSHGDSACASCHIFGDFDSLTWNLGNPSASVVHDPGPFDNDLSRIFDVSQVGPFGIIDYHPMKGPMTTQSLRGLDNSGPFHWRGDRTGGNDEPNVQPDSGAFNSLASFEKFNVAFVSLLGRDAPIAPADMEAFSRFMIDVSYPPNPIRNLDNSETASQARGRDFFIRSQSGDLVITGDTSCNRCHRLDPDFNRAYGVKHPGVFGTDQQMSFIFETQIFKTPHLRNQYQKIGRFGMTYIPGLFNQGDNDFMGDQIDAAGFFHDGSVDTVYRFIDVVFFNKIPLPDGSFFNPGGLPADPEGDGDIRHDLEQFMLAFPSNHAPIVGQQVTLTQKTSAAVQARIALLEQRADAGECDLVVKGRQAGIEVGLLYSAGHYTPSVSGVAPLSSADLQQAHALWPLTWTCEPTGTGVRVALDRDNDGYLDGDETLLGYDPSDPESHP